MAENLIMPTLGLTMTEGTVDQWYKNIGDSIEKGEAVCSISSEKLTNDVEAPISGTLLAIITEAGGTSLCQAAIGVIGEAGEEVPETTGTVAEKPEVEELVQEPTIAIEAVRPVTRKAGERLFATPLARKIAHEKGYELSEIKGTGGNQRITRRDVDNHVPQVVETMAKTSQAGVGLTGMRKVIAQRMHNSLQQAAQLTLHKKADITALMTFRKDLKKNAGQHLDKGAISLNTLVIKAVTLALVDYPELNAWYGEGEHQQLSEVNMGVAVAVPEGLMVPVLKNTNQQSLTSLAQGFSEITSGAKNGTLASDLLSGSTFTISNLGQSGIEYFTPILNTPEVGILGVGTGQSRLAFNSDKEIEERLELPLSLTFDHQVIDGAPAGEFLQQICFYLENPYLLVV